MIILVAKTTLTPRQFPAYNVACTVFTPSLRVPSSHDVSLLPAQVPHLIIKDSYPSRGTATSILFLAHKFLKPNILLHRTWGEEHKKRKRPTVSRNLQKEDGLEPYPHKHHTVQLSWNHDLCKHNCQQFPLPSNNTWEPITPSSHGAWGSRRDDHYKGSLEFKTAELKRYQTYSFTATKFSYKCRKILVLWRNSR